MYANFKLYFSCNSNNTCYCLLNEQSHSPEFVPFSSSHGSSSSISPSSSTHWWLRTALPSHWKIEQRLWHDWRLQSLHSIVLSIVLFPSDGYRRFIMSTTIKSTASLTIPGGGMSIRSCIIIPPPSLIIVFCFACASASSNPRRENCIWVVCKEWLN